MFRNLTLGGKEKHEKINGWEINRFDLTSNSASKKWETNFRTINGEGCKHVDLNLHQAKDCYLRIVIGNFPKEHIDQYAKELAKYTLVNYSKSFPSELTLEPFNLSDKEKLAKIIDLINLFNSQINSLDCAILPKDEILKEVNFIAKCVCVEIDWKDKYDFVQSVKEDSEHSNSPIKVVMDELESDNDNSPRRSTPSRCCSIS